MNHKFILLLGISAVSAFSFLTITQDGSRPRPAGSGQPATLPQTARAAGGQTVFAQDAPNADLAITARIREAINASPSLSVNARNVQIITSGGRVVLKGAVITAEEKRLIGEIAIRVQQRGNVDNQLVVRPSPSAPTALRVIQ